MNRTLIVKEAKSKQYIGKVLNLEANKMTESLYECGEIIEKYENIEFNNKIYNVMYIKREDQKVGLTKIQKKKKSIGSLASSTQNLRRLAINTAKQIKKRGQKRVGFFDDNLDKAFGAEFQTKLAKALGQDIALTITQTFKK